MAIVAAISPAVAGASDHARFTWQVIGIKDGDTLTVNLPACQRRSIRSPSGCAASTHRKAAAAPSA